MIHKYNQIFFANGEKGDDFSTLKLKYDEFIETNKHLRKLPGYSLVVDSIILSTVFTSENLTKQFVELSNKAESVICCRVSPLQKSSVVKLMRKYHSETISLAIGDGGNDVSMILEANIGKNEYIYFNFRYRCIWRRRTKSSQRSRLCYRRVQNPAKFAFSIWKNLQQEYERNDFRLFLQKLRVLSNTFLFWLL